MSEKRVVPTYQFVRVTYRPTVNHGQLQKMAEVVMEAVKRAEQKAS